DEWQRHKETAPMMRELPGVIGTPAPDLPLSAVRATRPVVAAELGKKLGAKLLDPDADFVEMDIGEDEPPSPTGANGPTPPAPPSSNGHGGAAEPPDEAAWLDRLGLGAPSPN